MDKKILASEIGKEITAATKPNWTDLNWRVREKVLGDLRVKFNLKRHKHFNVYFDFGSDNEVWATIEWNGIGITSPNEARQFAREIMEASDALDKAVAELKKQYSDVKIVSK